MLSACRAKRSTELHRYLFFEHWRPSIKLGWWVTLTNFDKKHCHKWALLLRERRTKTEEASAAIKARDFDIAKRLLNQVVCGESAAGSTDPGMAGSLL
jgi:hypothetical protein